VDVTPVDVLGHGTFVAGVIGARNNRQGVIGTAPGTPLWSVRVVDNNCLISEQSLICAIDWVTSTHKDDNEDNDIAVANISIAGGAADTPNCGKGTDPMHYAICRSVQAGVTYAVAAGNEGTDFANTVPATYDQVLTATAMGDFDGKAGGDAAPTCGPDDFSKYGQKDDQPAFFSNFATTSADEAHTVSGPGMCMLSTWPGGYNVSNGTSFASPAVAGSVALCISQNECTGSAEQVMKDYLHATKSYTKRHNDYGFGGDPVHPIGSRYYGYLTQTTSF
jgi:subtilisin family serine protease